MEDKKEIDLLDILIILAKRKWFIFWTTLIVSIFAVVYVLVVDEYWTSTALIKPAGSSSSTSMAALGGSLLKGFGAGLLGSSETQSLDFVTIMNSRSFSKKVINKFKLIEYLEIENKDSLKVLEKTIEMLKKEILSLGLDEETGNISIAITTKDRNFSADIANYYWQALDEYNRKDLMTKGKQQRLFLEKRITDLNSELDTLRYQMKEFQKKNKIIELDQQSLQLVSLYSDLVVSKIKKEKELQTYSLYGSINDKKYQNLINELEAINKQINKIESNTEKKTAKYILNLDEIPSLSSKYTELIMNFEIRKQVYEYLLPQYEMAKIEEIKDLPTLEVIDKAEPMGYRTKPKRAMFCVVVFFVALINSFLLSIFQHVIKNNFLYSDLIKNKYNEFFKILKKV